MKNVNKLKVGDKVIVKANSWESKNNIGDIGFVTELRISKCRVSVTNNLYELGNNHPYEDIQHAQ
jgi:hypothetical protein